MSGSPAQVVVTVQTVHPAKQLQPILQKAKPTACNQATSDAVKLRADGAAAAGLHGDLVVAYCAYCEFILLHGAESFRMFYHVFFLCEDADRHTFYF